MTRPSGSASAPPLRRPRPGEDALNAMLGADPEDDTDNSDAMSDHRHLLARLLGALGTAAGPVTVSELSRTVELDFLTLSDLLIELKRHGTIRVDGHPGNEVISLGHLNG